MKKILIRNIYYHEQFVFKTLVKGSNNNNKTTTITMKGSELIQQQQQQYWKLY